ncbi:MAG: GDSL family lipase [Gemmatimonadetes bacterium]|nr:GDSL family lipase [Gemmatimonadota bacterium]
MQNSELVDELFQGHIELQRGDGWVQPWRLPHSRGAMFVSPDEGLLARAAMASGVRLRFATESRQVRLHFKPLPITAPAAERAGFHFDLTIDGDLIRSVSVAPGGEEAAFAELPAGDKVIEIWLSQEIPVALTALQGDAPCRPVKDPRPRWVTYGSSLTHCMRAHSPARTWPATVARRRGLNLTSLGFGGQCALDAMVGMTIADLPAEFITLKLGINTIGGALSARTYPAAVVGLVQIIRHKQPDTPIALVSPIGYPPHETIPNAVGYTIEGMRRDMADVHRRLVSLGDTNLIYVDGLEVFDLDLIARYAEDQCHPNGDGIEIQAANFDRAVMDRLLA